MIKSFCGPVGSGKTTMMINEIYPWLKEGYPIYANTPIAVGKNKVNLLETLDQYFNAFTTVDNAIFLMDEANVWVSNYKWDKVPDDVYNRFFLQRKYEIHLLYTAQDFTGVAKKLRVMTNEVVEVKSIFRWPFKKHKPYAMGRPLVIRGVTYKPTFYNLQNYDDKKEAKYILRRQWVFANSLNRLFKSFDTLRDVTKGL